MREKRVFCQCGSILSPDSLWEHVNKSKMHSRRLRKVVKHVRMEDMPVMLVDKEDPEDVERVGNKLFESDYYGEPGSLDSAARPREWFWFQRKGPGSKVYWGIRRKNPYGKMSQWLAEKYEEKGYFSKRWEEATPACYPLDVEVGYPED